MGNHQPLKHVAMSFSGGGFRAAAFSLGCLSYLNECGLLTQVSFMASASGGTLASLTFAHYLYEDKLFGEYYDHMKNFLKGEDALKAAFDILEDDKAWEDTPQKGRNLINAFAKVYHKDLFDGSTWSKFFDSKDVKHVKQICANSTEFKNGLSFRFQNADNVERTGIIGNYTLYLKDKKPFDTVRAIRLGDITAASSCFPLGFEPIMYPEDFTYSGKNALSKKALLEIMRSQEAYKQIAAGITLNEKSGISLLEKRGIGLETELTRELEEKNGDALSAEKKEFSFGLMDGGIADNQAIQSSMLADERKKNGKFGTLIICDVTSPFMDAYTLPKVEKTLLNRFSLRFWGYIYALLTIGLLAGFCRTDNLPAMITVGTLMVVLPLFVGIKLFRKLSAGDAENNTWTRMIRKYLGYFFTIPVASFSQMVRARIKSTGIMVVDVFLKRIRSMWYDKLYESKDWENRRIAVMIYELSKKHDKVTEARINRVSGLKALVSELDLKPTEKMQNTAQIASDMGTTLWFDENDVERRCLESLIATGQFTMCYNLIMYICELEIQKPDLLKNDEDMGKLKEKLLKDWKLFQKNPEFMV